MQEKLVEEEVARRLAEEVEKHVEKELAKRIEEFIQNKLAEELAARRAEIESEIARRIEASRADIEARMTAKFELEQYQRLETARIEKVIRWGLFSFRNVVEVCCDLFPRCTISVVPLMFRSAKRKSGSRWHRSCKKTRGKSKKLARRRLIPFIFVVTCLGRGAST
jgi:hypothetical protein